MGIRVYRYGLLAPTAQVQRVNEQMRLAHAYYNNLVMLQRGLRNAMRAAETEHGNVKELQAKVAEAKLAYDGARADIRKQRSATRSRSETDEQKKRVFELKDVLIGARLALKEVRFKIRESGDLVQERDRLSEMANAMKRNMREHSGVYWGTYFLIEAAVDAAAKMPLWDGITPQDPHFRRWSGEGRIGVQYSPPTTPEKVFGGDTRLQIDPVDERAWWSKIRGERRRFNRTVLRLRVGSAGSGNREPIFASFPMKMHRPFPKDSFIRGATVHRRMIGPREDWSVTITVETPEGWRAEKGGEGAVAVDLGWRVIDDGIRVAIASDGQELNVSAWDMGGLAKADSLRSIRDSNFNLARERLVRQLAGEGETMISSDQPSPGEPGTSSTITTSPAVAGTVGPPWFAAATRTLSLWRSPARLAALCIRWRDNRFAGDEAAYEALRRWESDDDHLWRWETSQRKKTHRRRRDQYSNFAARLARQYETLVLERFDLRKIATRKDERENEAARSNRHAVAVSELRAVLTNAFEARGGRVVLVEAAYSTLTCSKCQHVNKLDLASSISQTCAACGVQWDQDVNASEVLMQRFIALENEPPESTPAAVTQKKWARAKVATDAKLDRKRARKAEANAAH